MLMNVEEVIGQRNGWRSRIFIIQLQHGKTVREKGSVESINIKYNADNNKKNKLEFFNN